MSVSAMGIVQPGTLQASLEQLYPLGLHRQGVLVLLASAMNKNETFGHVRPLCMKMAERVIP